MIKATPYQGAFQTTLDNGNTSIIADEPQSFGGDDVGFSPTDLLDGALASCTVMTINMYLRHKEWTIQDLEVEVERTVVDDVQLYTRRIRFQGLDDAQRKRVLHVANRCPVHKILAQGAKIETNIVE